MKNGNYAIYDGYNKDIICIKLVEKTEIKEFYRIRTKAIYANYEFEVVDEKDEMISIVTMVGDYQICEGLDMKCIDRGVYQKWIDKNEAEIKIEKEDLNS
ncbi:MAG: hypothetical protein QM697_09900 [Lachnospiraceae bacterium]